MLRSYITALTIERIIPFGSFEAVEEDTVEDGEDIKKDNSKEDDETRWVLLVANNCIERQKLFCSNNSNKPRNTYQQRNDKIRCFVLIFFRTNCYNE